MQLFFIATNFSRISMDEILKLEDARYFLRLLRIIRQLSWKY